MIPVYKYNFKLVATSKWPENVEHVLTSLSIENQSTTITDFHFEISQSGKPIAFDRLFKLDNAFKEFQIDKYTVSSFLSQKPVSSSLQDSLLSVLKKVGRSIPFHTSLFFIAQDRGSESLTDIEVTASNLFRKELPKNGIILSNDWWITRRQQSISMMVLPAIQKDSLRESKDVEMVTSRIGKIRDKEMLILTEKHETCSKYHLCVNDEHILAEEFCDLASKLVNKGGLELEIGNDSVDRVTGFSRKRIINNEIKELNFKLISSKSAKGQLLYSFRSKRNNYISLYFDFGSYSPQCDVWLRIQGTLWSYSLQFPYANGIRKGEISTPKEFNKVISNVKTILINSKDFIDKIERNHEKSPEWFDLYPS